MKTSVSKGKRTLYRAWVVVTGLICAVAIRTASASSLQEQIVAQQAAQEATELRDEKTSRTPAPSNVRQVRDVPYGSDERQRFDVYAPMQAHGAPVIFMVHGGAWVIGDKAYGRVTENKVARWVPRGIIFISANYRMLPQATPAEQAADVARALAAAQEQAATWGGDRSKFVLMGHSAGAHLVTLLAASPQLATKLGATPWLGTVALDSAAFDVEQIMRGRHPRMYDRAFGKDPAQWKAVSPYAALTGAGRPFLAVCSTQRDDACPQAQHYLTRASALGTRTQMLPQNLSHKDINQRLGEEPVYTEAVEAFLRSLDASLARALAVNSNTH